MLTREDKDQILKAFKRVDVKKLELDHQDQQIVKWFRFGSFNALSIASEIINEMPEKKTRKKAIKVS